MVYKIAIEPKQTFWIMTINNLMDMAAIEWSKVFGSYKDDTHWTNVIPKQDHDATREALLRRLKMTKDEWEEYRDSVIEYRDTMVVHHDLNATIQAFPRYDTALEAAVVMFDRLRTLADQTWLGNIPTSLDVWSDTVTGNMRAIVLTAFRASSELGSNVPGGTK